MEFPDASTIDAALDTVEFPAFAEVSYEPPAPEIDDPASAAGEAVADLALEEVPEGGTVAVGLGSRGIHAIDRIARAVVEEIGSRGYDPVVVPAMGSHGGASAEGQRETLAALGLTESKLGCPIDARMETEIVGESALGQPVHVAEAALAADAVCVVNRIKPHTSFRAPIESGLCKMTAIGLGKQGGAARTHEYAIEEDYYEAITAAFDVIRRETPHVGGVAVVENFYDRPAEISGIPADELPDREADLLERAREYMPTLPFEELDALVIDEVGKDVSGTGMDTNVVARTPMLGASGPDEPEIGRVVVRGLTEATHGNGHGIGLADLTTTDVLEELDLSQMYTNGLTSGSFELDRLPMALPTEEQALTAALSSSGRYDPDTVRVAWIPDTAHLSSFRVSAALADEDYEHLTTGGRTELAFDDGGRAAFDEE
ncbi:lactate racemase domain-containing protein [Saliphagus sp. LR7]|uniref:lactate racemase domain-containing protein n=1 Tax=Saliphagus sp. LR7 TaxID=2282654 RepID=UPI000DF7B208|nr:lactate racemase domain-containing protein [Saliphagus sp. LR7]